MCLSERPLKVAQVVPSVQRQDQLNLMYLLRRSPSSGHTGHVHQFAFIFSAPFDRNSKGGETQTKNRKTR